MSLCNECRLRVSERRARWRNGLAHHARCLVRRGKRLARLGAVHRGGAVPDAPVYVPPSQVRARTCEKDPEEKAPAPSVRTHLGSSPGRGAKATPEPECASSVHTVCADREAQSGERIDGVR
jgi:hypothetical protein